MLNTVNDSSTNQNSSSPQTPRSDLQTTNQQQTTAAPSQSSAVTQDQLSTDALRVGTTNTTVQNSTSTPSNLILGHDILNANWLWLIIPIALAIFLFKPQKKRAKKATPTVVAPRATVTASTPKVVEPVAVEPKPESKSADESNDAVVTKKTDESNKPSKKKSKKSKK